MFWSQLIGASVVDYVYTCWYKIRLLLVDYTATTVQQNIIILIVGAETETGNSTTAAAV